MTATSSRRDDATRLKRNIAILAFAQALFQSIQGMAVATTPLAALTILGNDTGLVGQAPFRWLGLARDSQLATVPIWVFHGAQDPVVPVENSEKLVAALQACGGNVRLTVYPDADHDSWTETYANPELYTWLLAQTR